MLRRALFVFPALALSCSGLNLENPNSYPCDYSLGPGARDEACLAGDVCGTNNVCQPFIYEGPRFEGQATLPQYGPTSSGGALLHPLALDSTATDVVTELPLSRAQSIYVRSDAGLFLVRSGHLLPVPALPVNFPIGFGSPAVMQPFFAGPPPALVLVQSETNQLAIGRLTSLGTDRVQRNGLPLVTSGYRVVEVSRASLADGGVDPGAERRALPIAWTDTELGLVDPVQVGANIDWQFTRWVSDPGDVLDVASLVVPRQFFVFVLLADAINVIDPADPNDAGVSLAASLDPLTVGRGLLKTDPETRVIAAVRSGSLPPSGGRVDVLSTFQVNVTADGPALTSPWADCTPCDPGEHIELLAPSVRTGAPAVDLICMDTFPRALRVVGSVALTQLDACLTEELDVPLSLSRVAGLPGRIVHWNSQAGLLIGGRRGELWTGETLTSLEPEFLERVPDDVAPANAGMTPSIAVIAGDYLAIQQTPENLGPGEELNGFRRLPQRELGVGQNSSLFGFVHGVGGWAVTSEGALARVRLIAGNAEVRTAGDLVTASEEPISSSIGGEAFVEADGGAPIAFFLAADDSLYFVDDPEGALLPSQDETLFVPVLTPEPSVPIRSLALERTPLGTHGIDRARGYLVTSRNVYKWELSGTPARWASTSIVLTDGEPMEVWFDSPRSALGRVGYRDGQIYSLPGGYQLAEPLPEGANGVSPQVIDYENLGGWPVAYATTGLFIAGWDQVEGKLQNRFPNGVNKPMTWREVKLAGADPTPWMRPAPLRGARAGKLFVAEDPKDEAARTQLHRLLLFNDDEVRQVARHLRNLPK